MIKNVAYNMLQGVTWNIEFSFCKSCKLQKNNKSLQKRIAFKTGAVY